MDQAQAAAAPVDLEIGGRTLRLSPLTDRDEGELTNWVRRQIVATARASLDGDETDREEVIRVALLTAAKIEWTDPEGRSLLFRRTAGYARFVWQLVHRLHPDATAEWIASNLLPETIDAVWDGLRMLHPDRFRPAAGAEKKGSVADPSTDRGSTGDSPDGTVGPTNKSPA